MKITKLEVSKIPPSWVWVYVHTDEGIVGMGEPYLENHADQVIAEVQRLEPFLCGEDPTRAEYLWHRMYYSGTGYVGGAIKMSALSGLDMAFWDIKGKACALPVHRLLGGGFRNKVKFYSGAGGGMHYSVEPGDTFRKEHEEGGKEKQPEISAKSFCQVAEALVREWGFRALKYHFTLGETNHGLGTIETRSKIPQIVEYIAAVRDAVGYDIDVAVDIHNPHPRLGLQVARALEPYRPLFLEEPAPVERINLLRQIVEGTTVPIAVGERWMGKWAFHDALCEGATVMQPDIAHAGGFTELKKIAAMAEAHYAVMAPHCPLSPLSIAACIQLAAAVPNFLVQEHNAVNDALVNGKTVIGRGYFKDPFVLDEDGCVAVPEKPGLGVEIDQDGMEAILRKPWFAARA